jgi:hypothetical protein
MHLNGRPADDSEGVLDNSERLSDNSEGRLDDGERVADDGEGQLGGGGRSDLDRRSSDDGPDSLVSTQRPTGPVLPPTPGYSA